MCGQAWEREETNIWETVMGRAGKGNLASVWLTPLQLRWKEELGEMGE